MPGRPATLRFDSGRASGFAGCNQFGGPYALEGTDVIRLGPLAMTKMACDGGMELEQRYKRALEAAVRYRIEDGTLVLFDVLGPAARFTRRK